MASLYKNNGIWYIAVSHNGTRKCRSLKTKDLKVAKSIKSYAETIILQELGGFIKSNAKLSFSELVDYFLKAPHSWSTATYDLNKYVPPILMAKPSRQIPHLVPYTQIT